MIKGIIIGVIGTIIIEILLYKAWWWFWGGK